MNTRYHTRPYMHRNSNTKGNITPHGMWNNNHRLDITSKLKRFNDNSQQRAVNVDMFNIASKFDFRKHSRTDKKKIVKFNNSIIDK